MATDIYQPITNPISGETFRAISFDEKAFVMEWTLQAEGYVPFEHIHLHQEEVFYVRKGELRLVQDGKEIILQEGQTHTVPAGAAHICYNNRKEVLDCEVSYKPGLDYDKFMQCLLGLTLDGHLDDKGGVHVPKMGYMLRKMKCKAMARPTQIPAAAFPVGLFFFYMRGVFSGWGKLYTKYTS